MVHTHTFTHQPGHSTQPPSCALHWRQSFFPGPVFPHVGPNVSQLPCSSDASQHAERTGCRTRAPARPAPALKRRAARSDCRRPFAKHPTTARVLLLVTKQTYISANIASWTVGTPNGWNTGDEHTHNHLQPRRQEQCASIARIRLLTDAPQPERRRWTCAESQMARARLGSRPAGAARAVVLCLQ